MFRDLRWVSIAEIISRGSSFVTVPLLTNALAPANYGLYRSILVAAGVLLTFRSLSSIGYLLQKRLPEIDSDSTRGGLVSAATIVQISLVILATLVLAVLTALDALGTVSATLQTVVGDHLFIVAALLFTQGLSQSLFPMVQGLDKFKLYSLLRLARELTVVILVSALFLTDQLTVLNTVLVYVLAESIVIVTTGYALRRQLLVPPQFGHLWSQFLNISLPLVPYSFVKVIAGRVPELLILATLGEAVLGIWAVIFAFTNVFQLFSKPFSQMLIPKISDRVSDDRPLDRLVEKYYKVMTVLCSPLVLGGWVLGPDIVRHIFGRGYAVSSTTMAIFLFAFGVQTVDSLGGSMFIGTGESRRETVRFTISVGIRLIFVALGTFIFQSLLVIGLGYVFENVFRFLVSLRYQKSLVELPIPAAVDVARFAAVLGIMGAMTLALSPYVQNLITVLIAVAIGAVAYFTSLLLSGLLSEDDLGMVKRLVGA